MLIRTTLIAAIGLTLTSASMADDPNYPTILNDASLQGVVAGEGELTVYPASGDLVNRVPNPGATQVISSVQADTDVILSGSNNLIVAPALSPAGNTAGNDAGISVFFTDYE